MKRKERVTEKATKSKLKISDTFLPISKITMNLNGKNRERGWKSNNTNFKTYTVPNIQYLQNSLQMEQNG